MSRLPTSFLHHPMPLGLEPPHRGRGDLIGNRNIPDLRCSLGIEVPQQRLELREALYSRPPQAETAGNRAEIGAAEDRAAVVETVLTQLVDFRPVSAVVENAYQHAHAMPLEGLKLLNVHDQAAVAFDQHDLAIVLGGRDADRNRDRIADRAELPHDVELLWPAAAHVGLKIRLVA